MTARRSRGQSGKPAQQLASQHQEASGPLTTRPEPEERRQTERVMSADERIGRTLDAVPDRVDTRDFLYQPRLSLLPDELINCGRVPLILDQGREGACTGFALAAVVNYLLAGRGRTGEMVSPWMLYELARRYDEWPGEAYVGSSARGAMKAWVRHGVCGLDAWPDGARGLAAFTPEVVTLSMRTPGGAFYRVNHRDVRDMHAALAEVGILYITLMVHEGWGVPGPLTRTIRFSDATGAQQELRVPVIKRSGRADAGHAVAIVGYTREGFIIQNSWGEDWGARGYALLPYEDYMLHATDVWVAQLGVPVSVDLWQTPDGASSSAGLQRAAPAIPLSAIRPYVVDIGNNGELSDRGDYWTTEDDIARLFDRWIPQATASWEKKRILLYLHGGLNDEADVARRIVAFGDVLKANEIYPIHIMWETGWKETIRNILRDNFTDVDERAGDWIARFREHLSDAKDRSLELTVSAAGTALWDEMKENAKIASLHPDGRGGMQILHRIATAAIKKIDPADRDNWELHVVGHSAGCIYASHAVAELSVLGVKFKTLQFLAPAIRVDRFKERFVDCINNGACPQPSLYILSEQAELDDEVGPYGKSLLHLVSNAFEGQRDTP
ncbi:MAG: C1 family peptidase, partial [Chloroflexota bacterium]